MKKLTVDSLNKLKEKTLSSLNLESSNLQARITVHMGTCGIASGASDILKTLQEEIHMRDIKDVAVTSSGCAGLCSREPMATVELPNTLPVKYADLTPKKIKIILDKHALGGQIQKQYAFGLGEERRG